MAAHRLATACALAALALAAAGPAHARSVADALTERRAAHDAARDVQRRIDELYGRDRGGSNGAEDRGLRAELDAARANLREAEAARDALREQIARQREIEAGIVPLLHEMVDLLDRAVEADLPFDPDARRARVAAARAALVRHDLRLADRFDAVVRAYRDELAYGYDSEGGPAALEIDGEARAVTVLRVGRIALYYVSDDASRCGVWDRARARFDALAPAQCALLQAADDAQGRATLPLHLPVSVPAP